jgi:hypothetical protein
MRLSKADKAFFDWLDEAPCTPNGVLVQTPQGEVRNVSREVAAREFRAWQRGQAEDRSSKPFVRLERAQNLLGILSYQLEREEREQ